MKMIDCSEAEGLALDIVLAAMRTHHPVLVQYGNASTPTLLVSHPGPMVKSHPMDRPNLSRLRATRDFIRRESE